MNRILISVPNINARGGAERYAAILASGLSKDTNNQVFLATQGPVDLAEIGKYYSTDLSNIIPIDSQVNLRIFKNLPQAIRSIIKDYLTIRLFKKLKIDIFFECGFKSETPGFARYNYYICHFPHNTSVVPRGKKHKVYLQLLEFIRNFFLNKGKKFYNTYSRIIANSKYTQTYIEKRWHKNSILIEPPCAMSTKVDIMNPRLKKIINIGRFERPKADIPHKGQHYLIEAFTKMTNLHQDGWQFHLVGSAGESGKQYLDELREQAKNMPIYFHPNEDYESLQMMLKESSIYWHAQGFGSDLETRPETQEHFGITTVEAMSAGTLPLVINTAGPKEVVENKSELTWSSLDELIKKTNTLASLDLEDSRTLRKQMIKRAHLFDERHFMDKILQLIDEGK